MAGRPVEHPPKQTAGANTVSRFSELSQEQNAALIFHWKLTTGFRKDTDRCIRVGRVPAGETGVVIQLVIGIPAEHHITKPEPAFKRGYELVTRHIFAAHHPIGIEQPDLDIIKITVFDQLNGIFRCFDVTGLHVIPLHSSLYRLAKTIPPAR